MISDKYFNICAKILASGNDGVRIFDDDSCDVNGGTVVKDADCSHWLFRGSSKSSYRMVPSVFRSEAAAIGEHEIFTEALRTHYDKAFRGLSDLEILCKMQHYGVPTRLLDLTESPAIAAFFALGSLSRPNKELKRKKRAAKDDPPKITAVPVFEEDCEDFYSDRVAMLSALPRLKDSENRALLLDALNDLFGQIVSCLAAECCLPTLDIHYAEMLVLRGDLITLIRRLLFRIPCLMNEVMDGSFDSAKQLPAIRGVLELICLEMSDDAKKIFGRISSIAGDIDVPRVCFRVIVLIHSDDFNFYETDRAVISIGKAGIEILSDDDMVESPESRMQTMSLCLLSCDSRSKKGCYIVPDFGKTHMGDAAFFLNRLRRFKDFACSMLADDNGYVSKTMEMLHSFARKHDPDIKRNMSPIDLMNGVFVMPPESNERVSAQKGAFALYGLFRFWNIQRVLPCFLGDGASGLCSAVSVLLDNAGFGEPVPCACAESLEKAAFCLEEKRFSRVATGRRDYLLANLSAIGIDKKGLGCSMDCTYLNMLDKRCIKKS